VERDREGDRISDLVVGVALDFWASLPSAVRIASSVLASDPALGFASCRVVGRDAAHSTGLDPDRITNLRQPTPAVSCGRALTIRSWASKISPTQARRKCPALQRIDGADALAGLNEFEPVSGQLPQANTLSEVLHRP